ncbi:MAG TPA: CGNR zinc finger domain-containing protein [Candidatus Baltobacteraceae bacterium]|jgi:predicted RNA-binding Zn ribbon-like protein
MADRTSAPDRLEVLREFVNTVELETGEDLLERPEDAGAWFSRHGIPRPEATELARVRAFRERLRGVLLANNGDGSADTAWSALAPEAAHAPMRLTIDGGAKPRLAPAGAGADGTVGAFLAIVYDAVADGTWARLKACAKDSCRWAFYDRSKNGSGTWCSMAVCGNRAKAQRRRLRDRQIS